MSSTIEFDALVKPLLGLPVSRPWRAFANTLFLELGEQRTVQGVRHQYKQGEACVRVEWDWRIERNTDILFGSSNSHPEVEDGVARLQGLKVVSLTVDGSPPELSVHLSTGLRLRSMKMGTGDPRWTVRLPDGTYLSCEEGVLVRYPPDRVGSGLTPEEREASEREDLAVNRWGIPTADPLGGRCRVCLYFIRLDGEAALLDYGVCLSADSPFDGRAVNVGSGCPAFRAQS